MGGVLLLRSSVYVGRRDKAAQLDMVGNCRLSYDNRAREVRMREGKVRRRESVSEQQ